PGVGHIGQQLQARVADARDPRGGLFEGVFQIGVGAEGKLHHDPLMWEQYSISRSNCLKKSFSMTPSGLLKKQARCRIWPLPPRCFSRSVRRARSMARGAASR